MLIAIVSSFIGSVDSAAQISPGYVSVGYVSRLIEPEAGSQEHRGSTHSAMVDMREAGTFAGGRATAFTIACVTRLAAKPAPNAERITGPKLFAAASPTKYSPGTDDSKLDDSTGVPLTHLSFARMSAFRNFNRSVSTLYPVAATTCSVTISRVEPSSPRRCRCTLPS